MSFDTSYQNTGLSEGQGRPLATPKSVTKHKAPIGGCRSTPYGNAKKESFSALFFLYHFASLWVTLRYSRSVTATAYVGIGALPRRLRTAPQSSLPFEKGRRTPTLNFTCGALPHTPHSPCGRRESHVAFPSARAVCRSTPSRSGSIFWRKSPPYP